MRARYFHRIQFIVETHFVKWRWRSYTFQNTPFFACLPLISVHRAIAQTNWSQFALEFFYLAFFPLSAPAMFFNEGWIGTWNRLGFGEIWNKVLFLGALTVYFETAHIDYDELVFLFLYHTYRLYTVAMKYAHYTAPFLNTLRNKYYSADARNVLQLISGWIEAAINATTQFHLNNAIVSRGANLNNAYFTFINGTFVSSG